jgi:hypothetical protein
MLDEMRSIFRNKLIQLTADQTKLNGNKFFITHLIMKFFYLFISFYRQVLLSGI